MEILFAFLPLIVFAIVRAAISQAARQAPEKQAPVRQDAPARPDPYASRPAVQKSRKEARTEWVSPEGSASSEGECVEENPNHCAVEHNEERANAPDAPAAFARGDLARAVVMSEILNPPVSLRGGRF